MLVGTENPETMEAKPQALSRREMFAMLCGRGVTAGEEDRQFNAALHRIRRTTPQQASLHTTESGLSPCTRLVQRLRSNEGRSQNGEVTHE